MILSHREQQWRSSSSDRAMNKNFTLKDLGMIDNFLGIQVKHIVEGLHLSLTKYINDVLCKAEMQSVKSSSTPMTSGLRLFADEIGPVEIA